MARTVIQIFLLKMNNELLLDQDIGKQIQTIKASVLTVEQHSLAEDVTPFGKSAAEFCVSKAPRLLVTKSSSLFYLSERAYKHSCDY